MHIYVGYVFMQKYAPAHVINYRMLLSFLLLFLYLVQCYYFVYDISTETASIKNEKIERKSQQITLSINKRHFALLIY